MVLMGICQFNLNDWAVKNVTLGNKSIHQNKSFQNFTPKPHGGKI